MAQTFLWPAFSVISVVVSLAAIALTVSQSLTRREYVQRRCRAIVRHSLYFMVFSIVGFPGILVFGDVEDRTLLGNIFASIVFFASLNCLLLICSCLQLAWSLKDDELY